MRLGIRRTAAIAALFCVAAAGSIATEDAGAKRLPPVLVTGGPQTGTDAFVFISGKTANPVKVLKLRVRSAPQQGVKVTGSYNCTGQKRTISFNATAPLVRGIVQQGEAKRCNYFFRAQLSGSGTITLQLLGR